MYELIGYSAESGTDFQHVGAEIDSLQRPRKDILFDYLSPAVRGAEQTVRQIHQFTSAEEFAGSGCESMIGPAGWVKQAGRGDKRRNASCRLCGQPACSRSACP